MNSWGVEVKAGQPVKCDPATDGKLLHLSEASLGEATKDKGSDSVIVEVKDGDQKTVIGILSLQKCPHMKFDLVFEKEFELSHDWKHGSVHFCGYYTTAFEVKDEKPKPPSIKANAAKPESSDAKPKENTVEPKKPNDDSDDKESDEEDSDGDKDMVDAGDDSDDDNEDEESHDDESSDEDEAIPKKVETSKKKPVESVTKTPLPEKKAKLVAQSSQESGTDGKKGCQTVTPYTSKQAGKPNTPKSGGQVTCKSYSNDSKADLSISTKSIKLENYGNFHEDVMKKILVKLPVERVLDFKFVCKSWKNWISDGNFIRVWNDEALLNDPMVVVVESLYLAYPRAYLRVSTDGATHKLHSPSLADLAVRSSSSSSGLLLVSSRLGERIYVYNPNTRKSKILPDVPRTTIELQGYTKHNMIHLAVDTCSDRFIVVYLEIWVSDAHSESYCMWQPRCMIYDSLNNAWKTLEFDSLGDQEATRRNDGAVCIGLILYWLTSNLEILVIDLSTGEFRKIRLPAEVRTGVAQGKVSRVSLLDFEGSLSVSLVESRDVRTWFMKKDEQGEGWVLCYEVSTLGRVLFPNIECCMHIKEVTGSTPRAYPVILSRDVLILAMDFHGGFTSEVSQFVWVYVRRSNKWSVLLHQMVDRFCHVFGYRSTLNLC